MNRTHKIGIVVQRAGEKIVGGSEAYAFQLAKVLEKKYEVDIISSCASDHMTWSNFYEPGEEKIGNHFNIIRFENDFERESYWFSLNEVLNNGIDIFRYVAASAKQKKELRERLNKLPIGFCEEWMKHQGPYSTSFLNYIIDKEDEYDLFLFMTYLYPTTYFGIQKISKRNKIVFIPTFHDEPYSFLPIFYNYVDIHHFFLTNQERILANNSIYKEQVKNDLIGFGLSQFAKKELKTKEEYFIYVGRLEQGKGVHLLYELFAQFNEKFPEIKLYTIGKGGLEKSGHKNIIYKGFVDDETKYTLIGNAVALIHPSALESLGIVLLEAFMMKTPVIVNAQSKVLEEHVLESEGGFCYDNSQEFQGALIKMLNKETRLKCAINGYDYYQNNYSTESYEARVFEKIGNRIDEIKKASLNI